MASILSICDCTSVYVFLCSFVKSFFNKNVCYYYQYCLICFGALFTAHPVLLKISKHNHCSLSKLPPVVKYFNDESHLIFFFFKFYDFSRFNSCYLIFIRVFNCLTVEITQKMKIFKLDLFKQRCLEYFG